MTGQLDLGFDLNQDKLCSLRVGRQLGLGAGRIDSRKMVIGSRPRCQRRHEGPGTDRTFGSGRGIKFRDTTDRC